MNKQQQLKLHKTLAALKKTIAGLEPRERAAIDKHLRALYGQLAEIFPAGEAASWVPAVASWVPAAAKPPVAKPRAKPKRK